MFEGVEFLNKEFFWLFLALAWFGFFSSAWYAHFFCYILKIVSYINSILYYNVCFCAPAGHKKHYKNNMLGRI